MGQTARARALELADIGRLGAEGKVKITESKTFIGPEAGVAQDFLEREHVRGQSHVDCGIGPPKRGPPSELGSPAAV